MAPLKLYSVSDNPPTLAVRLALKMLDLTYSLENIDFVDGEHLTDSYVKKNPQKDVPCIDDDGFFLNESIAILQYLADKYSKTDDLYPRDPQKRALVNHRLAFNLSTYYRYISDYVIAPIFLIRERTPSDLKKMCFGLSVFNTILEKQGTKYSAADHLTIADFGLVSATLCLEAIGFGLGDFPQVEKWYSNFKREYPELWAVVEPGMKEMTEHDNSPPHISAFAWYLLLM